MASTPMDLRTWAQDVNSPSLRSALEARSSWPQENVVNVLDRRLSMACAGQYDAQDEKLDMTIIRDAWLKAKVPEIIEKEGDGLQSMK